MEQKKLCVIGDPVEHSLSPVIHNTILRQHLQKATSIRVAAPDFSLPQHHRVDRPIQLCIRIQLICQLY